MLNLLCEQLRTQIASLPYAGKTAGLIKVATQKAEGTTEDGAKYLISEQRFPVAATVTGAQCWNNSRYKELAPNNAYSSIIYFEQTSPETVTGEARKTVNVGVKFRLVAWFNLQKIGVTGELPTSLEYELISILTDSFSITEGTQTPKINVVVLQIVKDPTIFSKYSYDKIIVDNMLLYPYAYFAIDCAANWTIQPSCYTFAPLTEITC